MFRGAMLSALASLIKEDRLIVVDTFDLGKISTKDANLNLKSLIGGSSGTLVFSEDQEQAGLSYRNILRTDCYSPEELSVYSLVKNDFVVFDKNSKKPVELRDQSKHVLYVDDKYKARHYTK